MTYRGFHLPAVALAFILVLAVGLVGKYSYERFQVLVPLQEELEGAFGVKEVQVERDGGGRIKVHLKMEAGRSLVEMLEEVRQIGTAHGVTLAVSVQDDPNPKLQSLFRRVQIAVEEAILTGEFTRLEEQIEHLAEAEGVEWELAVDRDFVYLTLLEGPNVLRRVISRASSPQGEGPLSVGGV